MIPGGPLITARVIGDALTGLHVVLSDGLPDPGPHSRFVFLPSSRGTASNGNADSRIARPTVTHSHDHQPHAFTHEGENPRRDEIS